MEKKQGEDCYENTRGGPYEKNKGRTVMRKLRWLYSVHQL